LSSEIRFFAKPQTVSSNATAHLQTVSVYEKKRTEKNKYKLKGEAYLLPFAMAKELMHIYFSIVELAHLPLPDPTAYAIRVVVRIKNSKSQKDKKYNKSFHPP
jgi:hypothetical protein